jgi:S-adenosylmethionine uptake transporter
MSHNRPVLAIACILLAITAISTNDALIKFLSADYPLHQLVFVRSAIGIILSLVMVQFEGGLHILRTDQPLLHFCRGLLVVISNMSYFSALAVLPLASSTALFFVAPLFITLLSIPLLGERVGVRRLTAVAVGFAGVILMQRPWANDALNVADRLVLLLPVLAALTYALMQILTRKLGVTAKASALAVYIQATFLIVSTTFFIVAGDGHFAEGVTNPSLVFLLRAWQWPTPDDWVLIATLGAMSSVIGYTLSQAYRLAPAATVAPFEYTALPLAILWGWILWDELPDAVVISGIALIVGSGLFVFIREQMQQRAVAARRPQRRLL